jgi:hypothetical protein
MSSAGKTCVLCLGAALALAGCESGEAMGANGPGGDTDTGTDTETGGDADGDADTDTDIDGDADTDTDADGDADTDTDADGDSDTGGDAGADGDADTDADTGCVDEDGDAWCADFECNDSDSAINPDADEIPDSGVDEDCDGLTDEADDDGSGPSCYEPEVLISLDRTLSMGQKVDGEYKWVIALEAIAALLSAYSETIHFGLSFFPRDADGCHTMAELLAMTIPICTNKTCMEGEIAVEPGPGNEAAINTALDLSTLCISTPIKKGLETAHEFLTAHPAQPSSREQFVFLITDGAETCDRDTLSCAAEELADLGVPTYVVGFGDQVNPDQLNNLACAGGTASDPGICVTGSSGCEEAQPDQAPVYYQADNAAQLIEDLQSIADVVECEVE